MVDVAFWMAASSIAVTAGMLAYLIYRLRVYRDFMHKIGRDVTEMILTQQANWPIVEQAAVLGKTLEEMKQWQSLFVRMVFEGLKTIEDAKLEEPFWSDLRAKYPDLDLSLDEKSEPKSESVDKKPEPKLEVVEEVSSRLV